MRISLFEIHRFSLPLIRPLTINKQTVIQRKGLVIELGDDRGVSVFGETSPLPGLSHESLDVAETQLRALRETVLHRNIPDDLSRSENGFERWLKEYRLVPSVNFGFESAVRKLVAVSKGSHLFQGLCAEPRDTVSVNALLTGPTGKALEKAQAYLSQGYLAFKLKVGRDTVSEDAAMVREVRKQLPEKAILRLDANRAWTVEEAVSFAAKLSDMAIAYIEEPVSTFAHLESLVGSGRFALPIALDESLSEIEPERLSSLLSVKAVVIKPTLFGIEQAVRWAKAALQYGMMPVISSCFESGIGLTVLANLAASISREDIPVGLDTLEWFEYDVLTNPLKIENGMLTVAPVFEREEIIKRELLSPVSYD